MRLIFAFLFLISVSVSAQTISIIPQPKSVKQPKIAANFSITPATQIVLEGSNMEKTVSFFNDYLQQFYLYKLKVVKNSTSKNVIRFNFERLDNEIPGAYNMTVDANGIYIAGDNEEGVFAGMQTLIQLLPVPDARLKMRPVKLDIPYVSVEDAPRFAYRGMHLDVCRNFFPVSFVKKYIDYLALHKFNNFHWHLTDDQGWRIEIKKYPKLTQVGGYRNGTIIDRYPGTGNDKKRYGGFYTQDQIKEVVKYAADRYINVVPEIEMPGHASAAIAAYPELSCFPDEPTYKYYPKNCAWNGDQSGKQVQQTWGVFDDVFCAGNDKTFTFLQDVIDEVLPLFPSKIIHVGGDECPKENWKRCPRCQQRIKDEKLKDEHELQSYFVQRMEKYLNGKGRTLIGWDEILEGGLAPNAMVMSWRGEQGGIDAAKQKHKVIMTPGNPVYFDHSQSQNEDSVTIGGYNPLEKVYAYEPVPKELSGEEQQYVLGSQANLWTEYIGNEKKIEYMLFPRMAALSEVLWGQKENRNWEDFQRKLMDQFRRYDLWRAGYSKAYFDISGTVITADDYTGVEWKLENKIKGSIIQYSKTLTADDPPNPPAFNVYTKPVSIYKSGEYSAWSVLNGKRIGNTITQQFKFSKATGKHVMLSSPASESYPGDGAFTLVNGVINTKGTARSKEYLGFNGKDCEAIINFGGIDSVSKVTIYSLDQRGSWIWQPASLEVFTMDKTGQFKSLGMTKEFVTPKEGIQTGTMTVEFPKTAAKYLKVRIKNNGEIPAGNPGAGNGAWLFVSEIIVE